MWEGRKVTEVLLIFLFQSQSFFLLFLFANILKSLTSESTEAKQIGLPKYKLHPVTYGIYFLNSYVNGK